MRNSPILILLFLFLSVKSFAQTEFFVQGHSTRNEDTLANYYKMVSWDDSQYLEFTYYKRDDATKDLIEFMNYRLLLPKNYDPLETTEYPMIVMLHGAGESGRTWAGHFAYDPTDVRYDNNGHQLLHGGAQHLTAVNKDPSDPRSFNGFVLFPQSSYSASWSAGWNNGQLTDDNRMVTQIMDHIIDSYKINQNKIYVHGLSGGAVGVWDIVSKRPDLFAAMLPMSGVGIEEEAQTDTLVTMPIWLFQGGIDSNPSASYAQYWIDLLESKGAKPRFTIYPNLGHGVWNTAYAEPDFFSWMLDHDKREIFVFGNETNLCPGAQITLGFSKNYASYQWNKDGMPISGANSDRLIITEAGTYTVDFMRQNGSTDTSFELVITSDPSTYVPPVTVSGSVVLGTPQAAFLDFIGPAGYAEYNLYKDGMKTSTSASNTFRIVPHWSDGSEGGYDGTYNITVSQVVGACESLQSDDVIVYAGDGPSPPTAPTLNAVTPISASQINIDWTDNSSNEDYFEIWRTTYGSPDPYEPWRMYDTIPANSTTYNDVGLIPGKKYEYLVRAVNTDGGNATFSILATTFNDLVVPSAPTNLLATDVGDTYIDISWDPSVDNIGVDHYDIYVNDNNVGSTSNLSYSILSLTPLTSYAVNVRAVDGYGNVSTYAEGLWVTTLDTTPSINFTTYYSKSSGDLNNLSTWGDQTDGSGTSPTSFSGSARKYIISNGNSTPLTSSWTVSSTLTKVIVGDGETLTLQATLSGVVEANDNAVVNIESIGVPSIGNCSSSSTVVLNANTSIPRGNYGNLEVAAGVLVSLPAGTTIVQGDITLGTGSLILGSSGNLSVLNVGGNAYFDTSLSGLSSEYYYDLNFTGSTAHILSLPTEDVSFAKIGIDFGSTVSFGTSTPTSLNLGSPSGGGLLLETNANLDLGSTSLNIVSAGYVNSGIETGTIEVNGGDVSYNSSSEQYSSLYFNVTNHLINDLSLNLTSNAILSINSTVDVDNRLKITDGSMDVNNNVTLLSNDTRTAYIDVIENDGQIIGDLVMQRYIRQGRYWRYIASPFTNATVDDWQETMPITGNFTGASIISGVSSGPSLYYFDETVGMDDAGWVVYPPNGGDSTAVLQPGTGYAAFIRADDSPLVMDMPGNPVQGDFSFNLIPDPSVASNDGWNLIGNPYASTVKWDIDGNGWTTSGVNDVIWVRDNQNGPWRFFDRASQTGSLPSGEIAPGQAFYVQSVSGSPSVVISETAKSTGQPLLYRETTPQNYVSIYLHSDDITDVGFLVFRNDNKDEFENMHDGVKKPQTIFGVSTLSSDEVELAVNKMSFDFCSKSVDISIDNANPGNYTLEFADFDSFTVNLGATLIDKFANVEVNLNDTNTYTFDITDDPNTYGKDRFVLVLDVSDVNEISQVQGINSCDGTSPYVTINGLDEGALYQLYLDDLPVSDSYIAESDYLEFTVDSTLIQYGIQNLEVKAWFQNCGNKYVVGVVNVDYFNNLPVISVEEDLLVSNYELGNQWVLDGESIDGAIESTYRPIESGEYTVIHTEASCYNESDPIEYIVTGIHNDQLAENIELFPNPASDCIHIRTESITNIDNIILNIYDINGSLLKSENLSNGKSEVDVQNLPKGLYIVQVNSGSKVWVCKFMKE